MHDESIDQQCYLQPPTQANMLLKSPATLEENSGVCQELPSPNGSYTATGELKEEPSNSYSNHSTDSKVSFKDMQIKEESTSSEVKIKLESEAEPTGKAHS